MASNTDLDKLKLRYVPWYCDKEPYGFVIFMSNSAAVTRSLHHGTDIEDYLDIKLTRHMHPQMLISSVISDDPDFVMPSDHPEMMQAMFADGEEEEQSGDTDSMSNVTVTSGAIGRTVRSMDSLRRAQSQSTTALPSAGSYYSLSDGARKLDRMLFSILRTLIIGTKCVLLDCTQDQSYIQGMCLLYKEKSLKGIARTKGIVCRKVSYIRRYREQSQSNELTIGQSGLTL